MSSHSRERRREERKLHIDLKRRRRRCANAAAARMKVKCSTNSINSSSFSSSQWSSQVSWQQNGQFRSQFGTTNSSHSHHSNSSSNSQQTRKKSTGSQSAEMRPKMMILQTRGQNLPATVPSYYKKKVPPACRLLPPTITNGCARPRNTTAPLIGAARRPRMTTTMGSPSGTTTRTSRKPWSVRSDHWKYKLTMKEENVQLAALFMVLPQIQIIRFSPTNPPQSTNRNFPFKWSKPPQNHHFGWHKTTKNLISIYFCISQCPSMCCLFHPLFHFIHAHTVLYLISCCALYNIQLFNHNSHIVSIHKYPDNSSYICCAES